VELPTTFGLFTYRIRPVYFSWILAYAAPAGAALWLLPGWFGVTSSDLTQMVLHLLFLQNIWIGMPGYPWIWFVATWSLARGTIFICWRRL
jgi:hypothetical protein